MEPGVQELGRAAEEATAAKAVAEAEAARVRGLGTDIQRKARPLSALPTGCCDPSVACRQGTTALRLPLSLQVQGTNGGAGFGWHARAPSSALPSGSCVGAGGGLPPLLGQACLQRL